jgi:hypothetical protein
MALEVVATMLNIWKMSVGLFAQEMVGAVEPGLDACLRQTQVACRLCDAHPSEFSQIDHDPEFLGNFLQGGSKSVTQFLTTDVFLGVLSVCT